MGATLSYITSTTLFAAGCERQRFPVWYRMTGWGMDFAVLGRVWLKRVTSLTIAAAAIRASAMGKETVPGPGYAAETERGAIAKADANSDSSKISEFVLAEVRRRLDPNPETEIVELKIDPDYRGGKDTYLVNAVLDAHGRTLLVGVLVTVRQTNEGLQAAVGYIH